MPIKYVNKLIKEKVAKDFVCDRCTTSYSSMDCAHVICHTFGYGSPCDGSSIELVLCEHCLLRLSFEWSIPITKQQTLKHKPKRETEKSPFDRKATAGALVQHNPLHPGVFLLEVYLKPARTSIAAAAKLIKVEQSWMRDFVSGKNKITRPIANKLAKLYGGSAASWLAMQAEFDSSVQRLKGIIPTPTKAVTLKEMDNGIRKSAVKAASSKSK